MKAEEKFELKRLSALEVVECLACADRLEQELQIEDSNPELVRALCEYGALGYCTVYREGRRAFDSARQVLERLTLDQLADLYGAYERRYGRTAEETAVASEFGRNETFERQAEENGDF